RLLRDAQVFPIWEGTTNVLSLDLLRAIEKENALPAYVGDIKSRLSSILKDSMATQQMSSSVASVVGALQDLESYFARITASGPLGASDLQTSARYFAFSIGNIYAAVLMIEFAIHTKDLKDIEVARRWCTHRKLFEVHETNARAQFANSEIIKSI
ncbi:MAG: hypothetical protein EOP06_09970, partial [Proteobacteria bacterium]